MTGEGVRGVRSIERVSSMSSLAYPRRDVIKLITIRLEVWVPCILFVAGLQHGSIPNLEVY